MKTKQMNLDEFKVHEIKNSDPIIGGAEESCCGGTTTITETHYYQTIDLFLGLSPSGTDETGSWDDEGCC